MDKIKFSFAFGEIGFSSASDRDQFSSMVDEKIKDQFKNRRFSSLLWQLSRENSIQLSFDIDQQFWFSKISSFSRQKTDHRTKNFVSTSPCILELIL